MKGLVVPALIMALAALVGYGIGRSTSARHSRVMSRPTASSPTESNGMSPGSKTKASEIRSDPAAAKVAVEPTKTEAAAAPDPLDQFFELILPLFANDAQELRKAMFPVTLKNTDAQNAVLDLIMSTEDPSLLEDAGMFLMYAKDSKLVARLAEAFSTDSNPARRAILAMALGQNIAFAEALPTVESILTKADLAMQIETLKWLSVESVSTKPDIADRIVPVLRNLGLAGESPEVRAAAVRSLRGDASEAGTTFLIQRVLHDSHVEVQKAALGSLPLNNMAILPPLAKEQVSALWTVFEDGAKDPAVRTYAAQMIINAAARKFAAVSEEERASLKAWIEAGRKAESR